ncbi:hypothetical protein HRR77_008827 [Exophiala dermatitidis]|nr:hypothetical protein HRR77_008827 [Exophiala dermatitidis]KAJ4556914.1 hypothetical protein HRR79_008903 [Exophiala dermatitidis]
MSPWPVPQTSLLHIQVCGTFARQKSITPSHAEMTRRGKILSSSTANDVTNSYSTYFFCLQHQEKERHLSQNVAHKGLAQWVDLSKGLTLDLTPVSSELLTP